MKMKSFYDYTSLSINKKPIYFTKNRCSINFAVFLSVFFIPQFRKWTLEPIQPFFYQKLITLDVKNSNKYFLQRHCKFNTLPASLESKFNYTFSKILYDLYINNTSCVVMYILYNTQYSFRIINFTDINWYLRLNDITWFIKSCFKTTKYHNLTK